MALRAMITVEFWIMNPMKVLMMGKIVLCNM